MRHPLLRWFQLCSSLLLAVLAVLGARPAPASAAVEVARPGSPQTDLSLSVVGENENPDGSWSGVDVLRDGGRAGRVQLLVHPRQSQRIWIEAVGEDGTHPLFPAPGESPVLRAMTTYSFPRPGAFFELKGKVRLVVTTAPLEELPTPSETSPARVLASATKLVTPLTNGSMTTVTATIFRSSGMGLIAVDLHD